jgi:putative acetyltransferase
MKIRKAKIPDSKSICELFQDTLEKINIADYSQKEIDAWKIADTPEKVKERIRDKKRYMCIAENNNEIIGIGTLKGNIITAVYVKSDRVGKGVGSSILKRLENVARKGGYTELSLDSSLTAVKFYKNHGYEKVRNSVHQVGDVELSCVIMKKNL